MRDFVVAVGRWLRSMLSEADGTGSASRTLMLSLAVLVGAILWRVFDHLCHISEAVTLGVWLGAIPLIVGSLVAVFLAPYGVNKGSNGLAEIVGSVAGLIKGRVPPQS